MKKVAIANPYLLIIILDTQVLNSGVRKQRLFELIKKKK